MRKFIAITAFGALILMNSCEQSGKNEPKSIENKVKTEFGMDDTTSNTEHSSDSTQ